ncbi:Transposase IS116/IS110/IS902 family protein [Bacteroidales bacterium Barb4]|nr:Transposase IS116/IS110/IS902 family protein [Bacteroidales bacterium Barb4]
MTVLCETNGFRLFNNIRQAVSYAGLDAVHKESGKFKGKTRISKKGNAAIRQCLFMPALSATNHNKNMQVFYTRIVEKNPQAKRKAIVACMRKLLTLVFVLWKKEEEYDENHLWGKNAGKARTEADWREEASSADKGKRGTTCPALDRPYRTAHGLRPSLNGNKSMD